MSDTSDPKPEYGTERYVRNEIDTRLQKTAARLREMADEIDHHRLYLDDARVATARARSEERTLLSLMDPGPRALQQTIHTIQWGLANLSLDDLIWLAHQHGMALQRERQEAETDGA